VAILGVLRNDASIFGVCPAWTKFLDLLIASSIGFWGIATVRRVIEGEICLAGMSSATLHLFVAIAFIARHPLRSLAIRWDSISALPSLAISGVAVQLARPQLQWPITNQIGFVFGVSLTVIALWHLGRSFAVLPNGRPIITRGFYRFIRHPMYFGELLMVAACCSVDIRWYTTGLMILAVAAVVFRIIAEERALRRFDEEGFSRYAASVQWRLVPLIW